MSTVETMAVYSVGRFQPPTIGHAAMIQALINTGKPAFVFVSSSVSPKDKNPLTSKEKADFLAKMFPKGVTFVDTATCDPRCGGPVAAREYLVAQGYKDITLIGGSDREAEFGSESRIWDYLKKPEYDGPRNPPRFQSLVRKEGDGVAAMSGTKARALALAGKLPEFTAAVKLGNVTDADAEQLYNLLRERLLGKRRLSGGADEDVSMFNADDEPAGGRRRLTRRKASSKVLYRRGSRSRNGSSRTNRSSYGSRGYSRGSSTW